MSWQGYFLAYCAIGIVTLLVMAVINRYVRRRKGEGPVRSLASMFQSPPSTIGDRIVEWLVAPVVAMALVILGWPLLIYFGIKEHLNPPQVVVEKVFQIEEKHLGNPVEVSDVEAKELVFDPLGAVPKLPFGHLNAAWLEFRSQMGEGDRLWTFSAEWQSSWGNLELWGGYVIVRSDAGIGPFFTTRRVIMNFT